MFSVLLFGMLIWWWLYRHMEIGIFRMCIPYDVANISGKMELKKKTRGNKVRLTEITRNILARNEWKWCHSFSSIAYFIATPPDMFIDTLKNHIHISNRFVTILWLIYRGKALKLHTYMRCNGMIINENLHLTMIIIIANTKILKAFCITSQLERQNRLHYEPHPLYECVKLTRNWWVHIYMLTSS